MRLGLGSRLPLPACRWVGWERDCALLAAWHRSTPVLAAWHRSTPPSAGRFLCVRRCGPACVALWSHNTSVPLTTTAAPCLPGRTSPNTIPIPAASATLTILASNDRGQWTTTAGVGLKRLAAQVHRWSREMGPGRVGRKATRILPSPIILPLP